MFYYYQDSTSYNLLGNELALLKRCLGYENKRVTIGLPATC